MVRFTFRGGGGEVWPKVTIKRAYIGEMIRYGQFLP